MPKLGSTAYTEKAASTGYHRNWLDYIVVTLLVFMSGNPAFTGADRLEIFLVLTGLVYLLIFLIRKCRVTMRFALLSCGFILVLFTQGLVFGYMPWLSISGFLLRFFIAYAAVAIVRDLTELYTDIIFYTCLASFFFYLMVVIMPSDFVSRIINVLQPITYFTHIGRRVNFVIHSYDVNSLGYVSKAFNYRNASYFWEPGAFSGYVLLAMLFLVINDDKYDSHKYRRMMIVFIAAILTTLSTAGYVFLPLMLLIHLYRNRALHPLKVTTIAILLLSASVYAYNHFDFLGTKIVGQYVSAAEGHTLAYKTRFGSLLFDMEYIRENPLIGWGLHEKTRYMLHEGETLRGMSNGFTGFIVKFGIIGMFLYLSATYGSFLTLTENRKLALFCLIFIVLLLNTQYYLEYPLFLGLMFLNNTAAECSSIIGRE